MGILRHSFKEYMMAYGTKKQLPHKVQFPRVVTFNKKRYSLEMDNMTKKDAELFAQDLHIIGGKNYRIIKRGSKFGVYTRGK